MRCAGTASVDFWTVACPPDAGSRPGIDRCAAEALPNPKIASNNASAARAEPLTRRELREERASMPAVWENLRK
jgi:hypothetical protein